MLVLVTRQLDGVKFTLGETIVTTRSILAGWGVPALVNRPVGVLRCDA